MLYYTMTLLTGIQEVTPSQWVTIAFVLFITYVSRAEKLWNAPTEQLSFLRQPYTTSTSAHWPSIRVHFSQRYQCGRLTIIRGKEIVMSGFGSVTRSMVAGSRILRTLTVLVFTNLLPGSTFRYRPDGLLFNSPTDFRSIYSFKANVMKGIFYKIWPRKATELNTWHCIDNAKHSSKRKVLNHIFSENSVRSAETFVIQHVNRWCELLGENTEKEWSAPCNMAHWADYLVFDILGDLCFGKSMKIKEPGENKLKAVPDFIASFTTTFYHVG